MNQQINKSSTSKSQRNSNWIVYLNDKIPFKVFKSKYRIVWFIRIILFYSKKLLSIVRLLYSKNKIKNKITFPIKINNTEKNGLPITLIVKESYEDYRIQTSREALVFENINQQYPASVYATTYNSGVDEIEFSVFLNNQINQLSKIEISGYIQLSGSRIERFSYSIDRSTIAGFARPTYWLDLVVSLRKTIPILEGDKIEVYLDKVRIDNKKLYQYITSSEKFLQKQVKKKQILILSFDGITSDDIIGLQSRSELFPNLNLFTNENFLFNNAITSSTVTASSAASLMTGLSLPEHCIYAYDDYYLSPKLITLSPNIKTLGQKARDKQIPAIGLFAFGKWAPQYGFARGFSQYRSINSGALQNYSWLEETQNIINKYKDDSFIYAMHHPGGHPPYSAMVNNQYNNLEYSSYLQNLEQIDLFLGSVFDQLKRNELFDDALIIFLADHGRSLASDYSRKKFQFTENRLRVPLIIKHPDWENGTPEAYPLNQHISAQSAVHEIVSEYIGFEKQHYSNLSTRTIEGITWVCETIDYSRNNYIGLVGYDKDWKYTLYYELYFDKFSLKEPSDCLKYPLNEFGFAEESQKLNSKERKKIVDSSKKYLLNGLSFAMKFPPGELGKQIKIFNQ